MAPDPDEPRHEPETGSPEAVFELLSRHRQSAERRRERRPGGRRGRRTALLGIVAALALAAVGVLVWREAGHHQRPDHRGTGTNALKTGTGPKKSATRKTRKKAARAAAGDPWRRGLQPWPASAGAGLPTIYYRLTHSRVSCAKRARYGCWKVEVAARYGCRRGVLILIAETRGGADLGAARAVSRPLAPRRRAVVELDAGETNVSGDVSSIFCQTG